MRVPSLARFIFARSLSLGVVRSNRSLQLVFGGTHELFELRTTAGNCNHDDNSNIIGLSAHSMLGSRTTERPQQQQQQRATNAALQQPQPQSVTAVDNDYSNGGSPPTRPQAACTAIHGDYSGHTHHITASVPELPLPPFHHHHRPTALAPNTLTTVAAGSQPSAPLPTMTTTPPTMTATTCQGNNSEDLSDDATTTTTIAATTTLDGDREVSQWPTTAPSLCTANYNDCTNNTNGHNNDKTMMVTTTTTCR
ncbi:hypothetical protein EDB85DRAFT_1898191 [Lactarius pseudohatsudake]|nr:hypothetical protein EDB85DRAFT_1898191 [Lactarius pseudohatsudake]